MYSSYDDGGYKSDGEAYQVCYNNHHHNHNNSARVRHHTGGASSSGGHHSSHGHSHRPIRSLSGQMIHEPSAHQSSRNGYLSDGEGYMIQNQRVSRSGKYGSQASSPRSDRQGLGMHPDDDDDSEESEEEEDEDEDEEEDLEENIEAEIHLNDMQEEKPSSTGATSAGTVGQPSSADLIVSYSAFQAEALAAGKTSKLYRQDSTNSSSRRVQSIPAYLGKEQLFTMHAVTTTTETATVRRSNSNNENRMMLQQSQQPPPPAAAAATQPSTQQPPPPQPSENGQRSSRRSSRSNSRQGDSVDSGTGTGTGGRQVRGGGASSSQSDHRSDGGYKSDGWYQQRSQPPQPSTKRPDGYRSEGSTESPKHHEHQPHHPTDHRGSRSMGCRRNHQGMGGLPAGGGGSVQQTHHMRSTNKHMPPPMPPTHFPPQNSRSLQSFSRQESTGSFYSSHSAPGCGRHPHGVHAHAGHHASAQVQPGPRQHQNLESCSTQSSSSSASAGPPDYNACAGGAPPSYEQAKRRGNPPEVPPKVPPHGNSKKKGLSSRGSQRHHHFSMPAKSNSSSRGAGSNELYYMGEFYG